jgi:hypothetical protein
MLFPQAFGIVIPSLITRLASLPKDTTSGYVASYGELMSHETGRESHAVHTPVHPGEPNSGRHLCVINLAISKLAGMVGRPLGRRRKGQAPDAAVGTIVRPWPRIGSPDATGRHLL